MNIHSALGKELSRLAKAIDATDDEAELSNLYVRKLAIEAAFMASPARSVTAALIQIRIGLKILNDSGLDPAAYHRLLGTMDSALGVVSSDLGKNIDDFAPTLYGCHFIQRAAAFH